MHSAGIRRVFWTNAEGVWEGAKVRELIDSLENPEGQPSKVFVTKHEVLMLLRMAAGASCR